TERSAQNDHASAKGSAKANQRGRSNHDIGRGSSRLLSHGRRGNSQQHQHARSNLADAIHGNSLLSQIKKPIWNGKSKSKRTSASSTESKLVRMHRRSDEQCREEGEDVRLQKGDAELEQAKQGCPHDA